MSKGTKKFKQTIQQYLEKRAEEDSLFAETLEKENKDIDGCISYILTQVKKIGAQGYTDDEIYNLAVHYYDEDDLEEADPIKCGVVVNHKPELTDEEKEEYREKARQQILREERQRMRSAGKPKSSKKKKEDEQPNLFSS